MLDILKSIAYASHETLDVEDNAAIEYEEWKHICDSDGNSLIHHACLLEKTPFVSKLILCGLDVNFTNKNGLTPLHDGAISGNVEVLNLLVKHGAKLNSTSIFGAPLHLAVKNYHFNAAKFLLENGAIVNLFNTDGQTPLHISILNGDVKLTLLLLLFGANPNILDCYVSPLELAVTTGEVKIVKLLLKYGADCHQRNKDGLLPEQLVDPQSETGLLLIAEKMKVRTLQYLSVMRIKQHLPSCYVTHVDQLNLPEFIRNKIAFGCSTLTQSHDIGDFD